MTDEEKLAHLKKLCAADAWYSRLMAPFVSTGADGVPWSVASNGRMLFAWRGRLEGVETRRDAPHIPQDWIAGALAAPDATTAEALRDWAGDPVYPSTQDCIACNGTGKVTSLHRCNCESCDADDEITIDCLDCDGDKKTLVEDVRLGRIGSTAVDRNYFAMLLDGITGPVRCDIGDGKFEQLRMCGDDWIALVMGRTEAPDEAAPVFEVERASW